MLPRVHMSTGVCSTADVPEGEVVACPTGFRRGMATAEAGRGVTAAVSARYAVVDKVARPTGCRRGLAAAEAVLALTAAVSARGAVLGARSDSVGHQGCFECSPNSEEKAPK